MEKGLYMGRETTHTGERNNREDLVAFCSLNRWSVSEEAKLQVSMNCMLDQHLNSVVNTVNHLNS